MTLIVYNPETNVLYADRRYSMSNGLANYDATKLNKVVGGVISTTGGGFETDQLERHFEDVARACRDKGERLPAFVTTPDGLIGEAEGMFKSDDGACYYLRGTDKGFSITLISNGRTVHPFALGSGAVWFQAYYALTKDVVEALKLVGEHGTTLGCGGGYDEA